MNSWGYLSLRPLFFFCGSASPSLLLDARKSAASVSPEAQVGVLSFFCSAKNAGQSVLPSDRFKSRVCENAGLILHIDRIREF